MTQYKEKISFCIGLNGTFWEKLPKFSIMLDGKEMVSGYAKQDTELYRFTCELDEDQEHLLEIRLENKEAGDTITNEVTSEIIKDMLLNIESIEIDDIELQYMKWSHSEFVADNPENSTIEGCLNLGWNGSYKFKFSSPFYLWFLKNI